MKFGFIEIVDGSISNQQVINSDDLFANHAFVTLAGDEVTRTVVAAREATSDWERSGFARRDRALHGQVLENRLTVEGRQNFTRKDFKEVRVFSFVVAGGRTSVVLNAVNTTQPRKRRVKVRHRFVFGRVYVRSLRTVVIASAATILTFVKEILTPRA